MLREKDVMDGDDDRRRRKPKGNLLLNSRWRANETESHIASQSGKAGTRIMNDDEQEPGVPCPHGHGRSSQLLYFQNCTKSFSFC